MSKLPQAEPTTPVKVPMVMRLPHSALIYALNEQLAREGKQPIPTNAVIELKVPSGGDYSGVALELDDHELSLMVRWDYYLTDTLVLQECKHVWRYQGTDRGGSHKGEDLYKCEKCRETEYR